MLFNSIAYAIFLPIVFCFYWFVLKNRIYAQNIFLLIASYVFYAWWDWRFLSLIIISSTVDYVVGINLDMSHRKSKRKVLLLISLITNLGLLGFFKYCNFFVDNFINVFSFVGLRLHKSTLNIILPVGISFYTFQTLSYTIDIYRRKIKSTKNIIEFFAFVSFFPQLVAGPIERASNLLPQFQRARNFDYIKAKDGLKQILWGLFIKVVIADNCATSVDHIFLNSSSMNGSTLLLGAFLFAFQIYCDFSGYSNIAIGTAKLLGFELMNNFAYPYFSRDIAEFWRRWHISLSSWFRDYLYIPLGGSRVNTIKRVRNVIITFTVSGLWHGANWTFVFWGFLHSLFYLPVMLSGKNRSHSNIVSDRNVLPTCKEFIQILLTFACTLFAWIFFRAESFKHGTEYVAGIISPDIFSKPHNTNGAILPLIFVIIFIVIEWLQRNYEHPLQLLKMPVFLRWAVYYSLIYFVFYYYVDKRIFIYFQF